MGVATTSNGTATNAIAPPSTTHLTRIFFFGCGCLRHTGGA
jgi:hypothetical protein